MVHATSSFSMAAAAQQLALHAAGVVIWEWRRGRGATWEGSLDALAGGVPGELELEGRNGPVRFTFAEAVNQEEMVSRILDGHPSGPFELELRTMTAAQERWVTVRGELRRDVTGRLEYAVGVGMDVTGLRKARDRAEGERRRLAQMEEMARFGSWEWDFRSTELTWSDETYRILGFAPGAVSPTFPMFEEMILPADRPLVDAVLERARETLEPADWVYRFVRRDGEVRWIRARGKVVAAPDGVPIRMFGTCVDVTDARVAEEALRHSELQLRQRAELEQAVADLGLMALRGPPLEAIFDEAVGTVARVLGVDLVQLLELTPDGLGLRFRADVGGLGDPVGTETVPGLAGSLAGYAMMTAQPVVVEDFAAETRFCVPDDLAARGAVSGLTVIIHGRDRPFGVLGAFTTRRRAFTEHDVVLLQSVANVAAAAIEQREIESDKHRIEAELNLSRRLESLGRLAGGVAHDFNNLLTLITGYQEEVARAVERGVEPGPDRRQVISDLAEIGRAAGRGAELIRQLLTFARRDTVEPELIDLNVLLDELREILGRTLGEDVQVVIRKDHSLKAVFADAGQLEQMLLNLATNARDAMPTGGTLTISTANTDLSPRYCRTHPEVRPGPYVRLTVRDTGSGMEPEVAARAFEPFFTTKAVGEGTGLGLATVHAVVARASGSVDLSSEPGGGTVVRVHLPAMAAVAQPAAEPEPEVSLEGRGRTVLVVEDEASLRELTRRSLLRAGYRVLVAARPSEALAICHAEEGPIDALLTDVVMPGMSGPELARRIEAARPGTAVLFMSGYPSSFIARRGDVLAPQVLLEKPFNRLALLAALEGVLGPPARP